MKGFKVAEARARFGELLDHAERGDDVVVERHGVRFRIVAERPEPATPAPAAFFAGVDNAILDGEWTWAWKPAGLALKTRRR